MTEVVRDQYGEPWLLHERSGSQWVLGLDDERMPIVCATAGQTFHVDLSAPRGVREIVPAGWQPISTAPKDRVILLAGRFLSGAWEVISGEWLVTRWPYVGQGQPSHWQPLPEPPA